MTGSKGSGSFSGVAVPAAVGVDVRADVVGEGFLTVRPEAVQRTVEGLQVEPVRLPLGSEDWWIFEELTDDMEMCNTLI